MKQPPRKRAAVLKSVCDFDRDATTTDSNIADPKDKDNVQQTARSLAEVYETTQSGIKGFSLVYRAVATKMCRDDQQRLHQEFREALR